MASATVTIEIDMEKITEIVERIKEENPNLVEVVRCKDCKHFSGRFYEPGTYTAIGYCNHSRHHSMPCRYDFFCADGEERDQ